MKHSLHEHTQGCFLGASHNVWVNYLLGRSLCFSRACLVSSVFEHTEFYILAFVVSLKFTVQFNGVFGWVSFAGFHCSELGLNMLFGQLEWGLGACTWILWQSCSCSFFSFYWWETQSDVSAYKCCRSCTCDSLYIQAQFISKENSSPAEMSSLSSCPAEGSTPIHALGSNMAEFGVP